MSAQSVIPRPPRFVLPAIVVGVLLSLLLTPLATFSPFFLGANGGAYAFILAGIICLVALIPMGIIGALVGVIFGLYYRRQTEQLTAGHAVGLGVGAALIVFGLAVAMLYAGLYAGMDTIPSAITLLQWLLPSLLLLLLGYSMLSLWVNHRLPPRQELV